MFTSLKMYRQFKKEAEEEIKRKQREYNEKKKFLSAHVDFNFLEQLIQKCNDNPNLRIDIHLIDGTVINMKTYIQEHQENVGDWISNCIEVK